MRQCLCSDSPRFTVSRFHLSSFPSLSPLLHFSSSLHFFFFIHVPLFPLASWGTLVSPQKKHLLCTEMRVLPARSHPSPCFPLFLFPSPPLLFLPLSPSTCNSDRAPCFAFRPSSTAIPVPIFFLPSSFRHLHPPSLRLFCYHDYRIFFS